VASYKNYFTASEEQGKDWYLVQWQENDEKSSVKRQDVSQAALRQFHATHKPRKRHRRN
jgi:hypothetical protein